MNSQDLDLFIVGAGPVGLMCGYLADVCGLRVEIADASAGPNLVGRADALNARTLQLLEIVGLFDAIYPLGKACSTSSVWASGRFISRQSTWWNELEGCFHKHFLMVGQSHLEHLLIERLRDRGIVVKRSNAVIGIEEGEGGWVSTLSSGDKITSKILIGADGPRSFVRNRFQIPFEIIRPDIIWAVIDGVIESDFPKVPEIIVFQSKTADVSWIPREGELDRFYVRMDTKEFTLEEAILKINRAMSPHSLRFKTIEWFSAVFTFGLQQIYCLDFWEY